MGTLRSAFVVAMSTLGICCAMPGASGASATIEPPPAQSPSSELPDGRVYELVSPANKHGNEAGASGRQLAGSTVTVHPSVAAAGGDAVTFGANGPAGEINASGQSEDFVAERTIAGWRSRSVAARVLRLNEATGALQSSLYWADYSRDLSHVAYMIYRGSVPDAPFHSYANIYLMGHDPLAEPTWLLRSVASPSMENLQGSASILGMTPDASIVYFAYRPHLLPQDATRSGWGMYESRDGQVSEVGVLPDGSVPAGGAFPAGSPTEVEVSSVGKLGVGEVNPASSDNQVSEDGRRLFFFSSGQLYVHEIGADGREHSALVSASQLPGHIGEEAADGVTLFENRTKWNDNANDEFDRVKSLPTYAYASSDGSHVVFQSVDQLTSAAPSDSALKVYDYDVDAGSLEYLPGVSLGGVVTSSKNGSSFIFVDGSVSTPELDLWTAGANGGSVRQIVQLPEEGFVGPGRVVAGDSVIVFQAQGPIPGIGHSDDEQIYRYEIGSNALTCVSCSSTGTIRSGNAYLSLQDQYGSTHRSLINDARGVSSDGKRIFFATPNALVSRDTNGDFDTYEWENGHVFLISSGTGADYSLLLDNSESGGDVFFTTTDELVQGDNDASFDVYDARIPRPGDNPPPSAVPCSGDVCQGPPSVAQLLGAPPSATFTGAGNIVEEPATATTPSTSKESSRADRLAAALRVCRKHKQKPKRVTCEKRERKRYAASSTAIKRNGGGSK
jgi:hypothetical protein